jgi:chromosome segregation ATPase
LSEYNNLIYGCDCIDSVRSSLTPFHIFSNDRSLRASLEEEQAQSSKNAKEYEKTLASYTSKQDALNSQIAEKEGVIANLTKNLDANKKQIEVIQLEMEVLQSKVDETQELNSYNVQLQNELNSVKSTLAEKTDAMKSQIDEKQSKISSLEMELKSNRKVVETTETALAETRANLRKVASRQKSSTEEFACTG